MLMNTYTRLSLCAAVVMVAACTPEVVAEPPGGGGNPAVGGGAGVGGSGGSGQGGSGRCLEVSGPPPATPSEGVAYYSGYDAGYMAGVRRWPGDMQDGLASSQNYYNGMDVRPDGLRFALSTQDNDSGGDYRIDALDAGADPLERVLVSGLDERATEVTYDPGGSWIAWIAYQLGGGQLWATQLCDGMPVAVSPVDVPVVRYAWAAAPAKRVAYQTAGGDIFVRDIDDPGAVPIAIAPGTAHQPRPLQFDAEGRVYFVTTMGGSGETRLYRASADGLTVEPVPGAQGFTHASGPADIGAIGMSADGDQLAFAVDSPDEGVDQVHVLDLSSDVATPVTSIAAGAAAGPDDSSPIAWSPDGTRLAVAADWPATTATPIAGVWVIPTSGAGAVRIFAATAQNELIDVEAVAFASNSARLFVHGNVSFNGLNPALLTTADLSTSDQDVADAKIYNSPEDRADFHFVVLP